MRRTTLGFAVVAALLFASAPIVLVLGQSVIDAWAKVRFGIENSRSIRDVSVIIGDHRGELFVHDKGIFNRDSYGQIMSATKWITAMIMMKIIERGEMSLSDNPGKYIPFWTTDPRDWRSQITIQQLLAMTSGLDIEDACVMYPSDITMEECVRSLYELNAVPNVTPGANFVYNSNHMHVAGYMAVLALNASSFSQIFENEITKPQKIGEPCFFESEPNPFPAGDIVTSGNWYSKILYNYFMNNVVTAESVKIIETDNTAPPVGGVALWHYGLGQWIICLNQRPNQACNKDGIHGSPGYLGFYPIIDRRLQFWIVYATFDQITGDTNELSKEVRLLVEEAIVSSRNQIPEFPREEYEVNSTLRSLGASTVAFVHKDDLVSNSDGSFTLRISKTFASHRVCTDDKFANEPAMSFCSGFLVSNTQVATSANCLQTLTPLSDFRILFGYVMNGVSRPQTTFTSSNIYSIASYQITPEGHAVVQLDNAVVGFSPLPVSSLTLASQENVGLIGYPSGLPRKYVTKGYVYYPNANRRASPSFYFSDSVNYGQSTGSPIISASTYKVVGIYATHSVGLKYDKEKKCFAANQCVSPISAPGCAGKNGKVLGFLPAFVKFTCAANTDCKNGGSCDRNGQCVCARTFYGSDCSYTSSPSICNNRGRVTGLGVCKCNEGFAGQYCDEQIDINHESVIKSPSNGGASSSFGAAVGIFGDALAVGEPSDKNGGQVSLWNIRKEGITSIGIVSGLGASNPSDAQCGNRVLLDEGVLMVSCKSIVSNGRATAAVYVVRAGLSDGSWNVLATLFPPTQDTADPVLGGFGQVIGLHSRWAVVSAPGATIERVSNGAVYLFDLSALLTNDDVASLSPSVIRPPVVKDGSRFGTSMSLSATYLAVSDSPSDPSTSASVHLFAFDSLTGLIQYATLLQPTKSATLGASLALVRNSLLISDPAFVSAKDSTGAIFVYDVRVAADVIWKQTITSFDSHTNPSQSFGKLVVAAPQPSRMAVSDGKDRNRRIQLYESSDDTLTYSYLRSIQLPETVPSSGSFGDAVSMTADGLIAGVSDLSSAVYFVL